MKKSKTMKGMGIAGAVMAIVGAGGIAANNALPVPASEKPAVIASIPKAERKKTVKEKKALGSPGKTWTKPAPPQNQRQRRKKWAQNPHRRNKK